MNNVPHLPIILVLETFITLISTQIALFTLTVQCTTKSAIISCAASQAGVAAAIGEEAKDKQYLDLVNQSGGGFIHQNAEQAPWYLFSDEIQVTTFISTNVNHNQQLNFTAFHCL